MIRDKMAEDYKARRTSMWSTNDDKIYDSEICTPNHNLRVRKSEKV